MADPTPPDPAPRLAADVATAADAATPVPAAPVGGPGRDAPTETAPGRSPLARVRARLRGDLRAALIDPRQRPTGDYDLVPDGAPGTRPDRMAGFSSLITATRLATMAISLLLVMNRPDSSALTLQVWTALVVSYAIFRAFRPIRYTDDLRSLTAVMGEVALHVVAVIFTGGWDSPLIFTLLTAVMLAGLARGYGYSFRIAVATVLAVSYPYVLGAADHRAALVQSASWGVIVTLVGIMAGYARRISGEADRERELALDRLSRLSDANSLLFSLHRVTQTLPASLDLGDVLDSTLARLRTLLSFDSVAVLLFDDTDGHWEVARHHGLHVPARLGATDLPVGLRRTIAEGRPVAVADLGVAGGGLSDRSGSGIYSVLSARGAIIGLLVVEHHDLDHFGGRELELVEGFVAPASLALDNARWFARLRTVGADEERTRIARDLHDRIGQSLAYLAFELDHIVTRDEAGDPVGDELAQLRDDVRGVIREVRDTLYDLRTDVSEDHGLAEVLEQYAARVGERSGLAIHVDAERGARLPMLQEREMWRVAQEALANVERHARADAVRIVWRCDGRRGLIDVTDNGVGFEAGRAGRLDSYGMLGMRERASSIGATLDVLSAPGRGTRVRCTLDPDRSDDGAPTGDRGRHDADGRAVLSGR